MSLKVVQANLAETDDLSDEDAIEDDENDFELDDDDVVFEGLDPTENSLESSMHNILQAVVDPVEWKTELERVGPRLRASQNQNTNEWRSHVDQTLTNKTQIEKILTETQSDLQMLFKYVCVFFMYVFLQLDYQASWR